MTGRKGKRKIKTVRNDLESRETENGKKIGKARNMQGNQDGNKMQWREDNIMEMKKM